MKKDFKVMTENPLNAETRIESLRSWTTRNNEFFSRNQSQVLTEPIPIETWKLSIDGEVENATAWSYEEILRLPKVTVANAIECSGNGRALLRKPARGNPWTTGGVGNAVWAGVWLGDLLRKVGLTGNSRHVAFAGLSDPSGRVKNSFIRSIPIDKALSSTLLAYEMNGVELPPEHGYPLRGLPLGWTGANCVKWLVRITVTDRPQAGHFMDNVYRIYSEGQAPSDGVPVTSIPLKSFITSPLAGERVQLRSNEADRSDSVTIGGVAYGGENDIAGVEISVDGGSSWDNAQLVGPRERWAWKQWQYRWTPQSAGQYTLMSRATDTQGIRQPMQAAWNVLGYGNNGVEEHAIVVHVEGLTGTDRPIRLQ
ncbi:MAG TPA: sulfite oxidase [Spirochaetia bacterium]|nr:sulfite oxidase [Spirochaetia bacterium]